MYNILLRFFASALCFGISFPFDVTIYRDGQNILVNTREFLLDISN